MAHIMPFAAHGDTLPAVKAEGKMKGRGDDRKCIGAEITVLLTADSCAHVPIVIEGYDMTRLPDRLSFQNHNVKLSFIQAKFKDLVIEFSGGDYGAIRYSGRATNVEFLNL